MGAVIVAENLGVFQKFAFLRCAVSKSSREMKEVVVAVPFLPRGLRVV